MKKVLLVDEIAARYGLSSKSIHSILSRNPGRLPHPTRIPGGRRLFWPEERCDQFDAEKEASAK